MSGRRFIECCGLPSLIWTGLIVAAWAALAILSWALPDWPFWAFDPNWHPVL